MNAVVKLENVSFSYATVMVLEHINLTIEAEEFFGLIGPNAAGKSTLIKLLLGLLSPDQGTITVLGASPTAVRHRIGFVPQFPSFRRDFPITVEEVVLLGTLGPGMDPGGFSRAVRRRIGKTLEAVEAGAIAQRPLSTLSGGQLQRVLIARALACEPELLILDEPTANIDVQAEEDIFGLLRRYNEHMTIIVVSHDIAFISGYVNRVGCLNRTLVCHETGAISGKTIEELYGNPVHMIHHRH